MLQAAWDPTEAFGMEEASELEKVLITLLDTDLDEEDNNGGDEVSAWPSRFSQPGSHFSKHFLSCELGP